MLIFLSGNLFADNKIQNNEDRVTDISLQIRCMVCQSQTIDDSDAPLAKDLKQLVRKMVYEGKSNDEIFDFLRSKYGDYILMKPRFNLSNILLYHNFLKCHNFMPPLQRVRGKSTVSAPGILSVVICYLCFSFVFNRFLWLSQ